jgi:hypothetical protein
MRNSQSGFTAEELRKTLRALEQTGGNQTRAAEILGIKRCGVQRRLAEAKQREMIKERPKSYENADGMVMPELVSSELSAAELIDAAAKRFSQHDAARNSRRWMEIKAKSNRPMAVCFMGDPHIDSPGCNWPLLKRDIEILAKTPGMYAVNIGDTTDNWVGRLQRLYADHEMTKRQAWKLVKYFFREAGINWLCIILGNHDMWNDGDILIKANAQPLVPVEEWQSRFQIVFPNGSRVRVNAAHDFPGHSMWNPQHGPQKAALFQEEADLFVAGHKHIWALNETENNHRGNVYWLVRCRGYKFHDAHAETLGFGSQKYGASITAVIDPTTEGPKRIRCFSDLEQASDFLTYLRGRS